MTLDDRVILVTSGTGSFGRKFTEIVLKEHRPKKLIIFSRDELKQHEMRRAFPDSLNSPMRYFIGEVRDWERLARAFNHIGPRRGEVFASSNFAKQIAEIEVGKRPAVVHVGNLKARRDFTDVRDIVQGYSLALEQGVPGEAYVLASGKSYAIQEILQML